MRRSPLATPATILPIVPDPDDECGSFGGMRFVKGN
jgi:hypothetical protein